MIYDTICLSGGGFKSLYQIGALDYLEKNKIIILNKINNFIGTSSGAIMCFFLSLSYSIQDIKNFILDFNFNILLPDFNIDNIFLNFGLDNGKKITYIITMFLKNKYNIEDITFNEHYILTKIKLSIIGCNYTKKKEVCFNVDKTPNMSIITAIRISISIPLLFTPVLYNDEYYIDGGVFNNFPINYCNINTTLGINTYSSNFDEDNKLDNIINFILSSFSLLINANTNKINSLNILNIKINKNMNFLNFELSNNEKNDIINSGYIQTNEWINNIPTKICESIINNIILTI